MAIKAKTKPEYNKNVLNGLLMDNLVADSWRGWGIRFFGKMICYKLG
jgi:hypothetical protein